YICGNGGSGANAIHIENDLTYAASRSSKRGLNINCLNSNSSVLTCLGNDTNFRYIFSKQLESKAKKNDLLIILSGSGNSQNIVESIKVAKKNNLDTFGIIGFDGGKVKKIVHNYIHIPSFNMQICEDIQMNIFHIITDQLSKVNINIT
ncbi:SIS domain-containing protein, partial [Alphaproteobacteria bacterium]|nr:SIS domain-containing protein [Alphaproteobacteria bacterium]